MKKQVGFLLLFCFIIISCDKDRITESCHIQNHLELEFLKLEEHGLITSLIEKDNETIILSNFPEIRLTAVNSESFALIWSNNISR